MQWNKALKASESKTKLPKLSQNYVDEQEIERNGEFESVGQLEARAMDEIIEEEPAVQDDVQEDLVKNHKHEKH